MYASGMQAKVDAEKRREEMLTGKAEVELRPEQQAGTEVSRVRRLRGACDACPGGRWVGAVSGAEHTLVLGVNVEPIP